jgi:spore coat polysaccharide biosynthesis protein SpsF
VNRRPRLLHVVQARMGSHRLPGKVLAPIAGWPLLQYTVGRALAAGFGDVLVATTTRAEDDAIAMMAGQLGVAVVRGADADVLARFALVARRYPEAQWLARWTADNPFSDIGTVGRLLASMPESADYGVEEGLPVGGAVEIFSSRAVLEADREATAPDDREHVTLWMKRFDAKRQVRLPAPEASRAPGLRLTVDTLADLQCARQVATELAARGWDPRLAPLPEVIACARAIVTEEVA